MCYTASVAALCLVLDGFAAERHLYLWFLVSFRRTVAPGLVRWHGLGDVACAQDSTLAELFLPQSLGVLIYDFALFFDSVHETLLSLAYLHVFVHFLRVVVLYLVLQVTQ